MKNYENVKIELLALSVVDIISTSYPLDSDGTETPILPTGTANTTVSDSAGVASNY